MAIERLGTVIMLDNNIRTIPAVIPTLARNNNLAGRGSKNGGADRNTGKVNAIITVYALRTPATGSGFEYEPLEATDVPPDDFGADFGATGAAISPSGMMISIPTASVSIPLKLVTSSASAPNFLRSKPSCRPF